MAILSNVNGKFAVESTGAIQFNGSNGTSGYVLKSNGNASPTWVDPDTIIGPYLPLSGGTLTGTTSTAAGIAFNVGGVLTTKATSASNDIVAQWQATNANNCATFRTTDSGYIFRIHAQNSGTIYVQNDDGSNYLKIPDSGSNEVSGDTTFTGELYVPNKLIHVGDTDTWIQFETDVISLRTGGTDRLTLTNTSATFAGKIIPNANIELPYGGELRTLDSAGGVRTIARANSNKLQYGWSYAGEVEFMGGGSYTPRITINTDGSTTFAGKIIASEGVQFTGGSIATATAVLHTNNIIYFRGGSNGLFIQNADGSDGYYISNSDHTWDVGSSAAMKLNSTGLGIGTTTPQKALHIEGASGASASQLLVCGPSDTIGDTAGILLRAEGGEGDSALRAKGGIFFEREAANGLGKLHLCNNKSNNNDSADLSDAVLTILQDGQTSFVKSDNTSTPAGSINHASNNFLYVTGGTGGASFGDDSHATRMIVHDNDSVRFDTSGSERLRITSGGNVGIGETSPGQKLEVNGNVKGDTAMFNVLNNSANSANIIYRSGTTTIVGGGSSSNKLYVLDNGDVGVNDSSPSYKLDADGTIRATGDVIAYSDRRVKENIKTIDNALNKVLKLRGVSYNRKDIEDKSTKIGVIAQEVLKTIPEVVEKDLEDKYSVAYGNMAGLFIEAIKELEARVKELENK